MNLYIKFVKHNGDVTLKNYVCNMLNEPNNCES